MKNTAIALSVCIFPLSYAYSAVVSFEIYAPQNSISANQQFDIEARFKVPDKWYIHSAVPEKNPSYTKIEFKLPSGFKLLSVEWSKTSKFVFFDNEIDGYSGDNGTARAKIVAPPALNGMPLTVGVKASWVACSTVCIPESSELELKLPTVKSSVGRSGPEKKLLQTPPAMGLETSPPPKISSPHQTNDSRLIAMIAAAFAGGIILNLMPCVLPVLGLKILSFSTTATTTHKVRILSSLAYVAGIMVSFAILAALLLFLRNTGESFGWGFQLQNPVFTGLMALLFFAIALNLVGAYEITAGFADGTISSQLENSKSMWRVLLKSLLSGTLAVFVASPCTTPFMASALGFALAANTSAWETFSVFFFLGLGMASPYLTFSLFPGMAKILPHPGTWMGLLKKILSIPLFATVIWLSWIHSNLDDASIASLLLAIFILSIGLIFYGIYSLPHYGKNTRIFAKIVCVVLTSCAIFIVCLPVKNSETPRKTSAQNRCAWSIEKQNSLRNAGYHVYVDFTASWCLTCQYNKKILYDARIKGLLKKHKIVVLTADWTNKNTQIYHELEKFGRAGVPLNLIYPADTKLKPIILPSILTRNAIIEAVDKLK